MAKVAFTKLALQRNGESKNWQFNDQTIEVKEYIPIKQKMEMAQSVIQQVIVNNNTYMDEFAFRVFMDLEIVFNYTNISFTDKQKEDLYKLYDLFVSSGFIKELRQQINCDQLDELELYTYETLHNYFNYRNSVYGIMDTMNQDYSNLKLDIDDLQDKISNPESLGMVKDILTKMG